MSEQKAYNIKVNTGAVNVLVKDENDNEIGSITINPSDMEIVTRFEKVQKELENFEIKEDAGLAEFILLSDKTKELINYIMNYNVSNVLFSKCNPFTLLPNGDFYVEHILEVIGNLIEKVTNQRIKKKEAKIKKRTAKYTTQYHK